VKANLARFTLALALLASVALSLGAGMRWWSPCEPSFGRRVTAFFLRCRHLRASQSYSRRAAAGG